MFKERIKNLLLKRVFLSLLFTSSFLIGALTSYLYLRFSNVFVKTQSVEEAKETFITLPKTSYNVLLLGYGGAGHPGGSLSDAILVLNVDPKDRKAALISIPRDLWVEIPVRSDKSEKHKINNAYAIGSDDAKFPLKEPKYKGEVGGGIMAKKVVTDVTGLPIQYYVAVDFEGLKKIVDTLEGVEVDVPVTFDDYFYPIKGRENDACGKTGAEIAKLQEQYSDTELHHQFECRYEHIHFDQGKVFMDGETALKFVRSRSSREHGGDFARSERQRAVLLGIRDELISMNALERVDELFYTLVKMVRTDLDLKTIKDLLQALGKPQDYKVTFVALTDKNVLVSTKSFDGQFILIPKEGEGVFNGVQQFIYQQLGRN